MWTPPPHGPGSLNKWKGESEPSTSQCSSLCFLTADTCVQIYWTLVGTILPHNGLYPFKPWARTNPPFPKMIVRDFCHTSEGRLLTHCLGTQFMSFQTNISHLIHCPFYFLKQQNSKLPWSFSPRTNSVPPTHGHFLAFSLSSPGLDAQSCVFRKSKMAPVSLL